MKIVGIRTQLELCKLERLTNRLSGYLNALVKMPCKIASVVAIMHGIFATVSFKPQ